MVDPERLREMISLISFESGRGKRARRISSYYRSDYLGLNMIRTFFLTTLADLIIAALIAAGNAEKLLDSLVYVDFGSLLPLLLAVYILTIAVFEAVTVAVSVLQMSRAARDMSDYELHLRDLEELYKRK